MAQAQIDENNFLLAIPGVVDIVERARQEGFQAGVNAARNEIWQGLNILKEIGVSLNPR